MNTKYIFNKKLQRITPKRLMEFFICAIFILFIILLVYFAFTTFIPLFHQVFISGGNDEEAVLDYLQKQSGMRGLISLAALQILQVITIFFPGAAIQIAGGLIYGTWRSFITCLISFVFGNTMIFYLNRHNFSLINKLFSPDNKGVKKVSDWLNSSEPGFMTMLAYMIPGIPNGFVPYVAAKTNVSIKHFIFSVLFGSFFQVFIMCAIGHQIIRGNWFFSLILIIFSIAAIIILYLNKDRIIQFRKSKLK